jgi:4-diphosphocytidyl-2-C-methyl-D-erythritol kinase
MVWSAAGRRGEPRDVTVRIAKRIPLQSGLGGGSSDAAAAIRGLSRLWRARLPEDVERAVAARIGADVPFFFEGGTALGLDRGDLLFPLVDLPPQWITLVIPAFGVSTKDAYGWFDSDDAGDDQRTRRGRGSDRHDPSVEHDRLLLISRSPRTASVALGGARGFFGRSKGGRYGNLPAGEYCNDLEGPVAARHPGIARIVGALRRGGAEYAAMSGSGSAVFGIFESRALAARAARMLTTAGRRAVVTRMVGRARYAALAAPK